MTTSDTPTPKRPRTIAAASGTKNDPAHGSIMPPLYLSATFEYPSLDEPPVYDYTRSGNPTRTALSDAVAALEGGGGAVSVCSGVSAIDLILQSLKPGSRVVAPFDAYGGTRRLMNIRAAQGLVAVDWIDVRDEAALSAALDAKPALVYLETPSNPLLKITDIAATARAAKAAGAKVAVDSTFMSPARQRPIELGCDYVAHSASKFINGHADIVGGVLVAKDADEAKHLAWLANTVGLTSSPFDAYQTLRGLRTLHLRVKAADENTMAVATFLNGHDAVARVNFPGLPDHPGHDIARRQQDGFGALLSFELAGGRPAAKAFLEALEEFSLAASLGGVDSLACQPWSMTEFSVSEEERLAAGVTEGLVRLAVGIEDPADLLADLDQALGAAANA